MDVENEIRSLAGDTLALQIVVANVLGKLADNTAIRPANVEALNQAADDAENLAIHLGKSASPEHTVKALRIIEELRAVGLGNEGKPKRGVYVGGIHLGKRHFAGDFPH